MQLCSVGHHEKPPLIEHPFSSKSPPTNPEVVKDPVTSVTTFVWDVLLEISGVGMVV